jgi:hypothetical protein
MQSAIISSIKFSTHKHTRIREDNISIDLKDIRCGDVGKMQLHQYRVQSRAQVSIKCIDQLSD